MMTSLRSQISDLKTLKSENLGNASSTFIINCDRQGVKRQIATVGLRGEHSMRAVQYVGEGVRLADDVVDAGSGVVFFGDHFGETGRDDDRQVRAELFDPPRDV